MKNSGICPKCNSNEVYCDINRKASTDDRSNVFIAYNKFIGVMVAKTETYVCLNCGYLEEYFTDKDLVSEKIRDRIKEKWIRVKS